MLRILPFMLSLSAPMPSTDNVAKVPYTAAAGLNQNLAVGDHIYLTLQDGRGWETVRYTHTAALTSVSGIATLAVDRAMFDTARRSWPPGQCLLTDRSEGTLREFDLQNAG